jgi:hypothetical protein
MDNSQQTTLIHDIERSPWIDGAIAAGFVPANVRARAVPAALS